VVARFSGVKISRWCYCCFMEVSWCRLPPVVPAWAVCPGVSLCVIVQFQEFPGQDLKYFQVYCFVSLWNAIFIYNNYCPVYSHFFRSTLSFLSNSLFRGPFGTAGACMCRLLSESPCVSPCICSRCMCVQCETECC